MSTPVETFLAAQQAFADRVHAVTEAQWQLSTPCSEWTVADLVEHIVDEHNWAPPLIHGHDLDGAKLIVDGAREAPADEGAGANLAAAWDQAAVASADAFSEDGALERTVHLTRGEASASDYLDEMILDLVVHAWDLGTAIGYDQPLPAGLVETAYEWTQAYGDLTATGMFAPPVEVGDDASATDKLVALTGRNPA